MKITKATRSINIGAGIAMAVLGFAAAGAGIWLMAKGSKPVPVVVPTPVPDLAACRALAPQYRLVERPAPKVPAGQKAPWAADGIHFIQSDLNDPRLQLLNITAFQTHCGITLDYFCLGDGCLAQSGNFMHAVFLPRVPVGGGGA